MGGYWLDGRMDVGWWAVGCRYSCNRSSAGRYCREGCGRGHRGHGAPCMERSVQLVRLLQSPADLVFVEVVVVLVVMVVILLPDPPRPVILPDGTQATQRLFKVNSNVNLLHKVITNTIAIFSRARAPPARRPAPKEIRRVLLHLTAVALLEGPRKTRYPGLPLALVLAAARNAARRYEDCAGDFAQPMLVSLPLRTMCRAGRTVMPACLLGAGCYEESPSIQPQSIPRPRHHWPRIDCVGDEDASEEDLESNSWHCMPVARVTGT